MTSPCSHDVAPQLYLTQLLTNLPSVRLSDLTEWLPDEWKQRQTASPHGQIRWRLSGRKTWGLRDAHTSYE